MTTRRGFLLGMLALGAAPAIVRAESLMRIWVPPQTLEIGSYESFRFITSPVLPDEYYIIMHPSAEEAMRELMLAGSATVIYTREIVRHG